MQDGEAIWNRVKETGGIEVVIAYPVWCNASGEETLRRAVEDTRIMTRDDVGRQVHLAPEKEAVKWFVMNRVTDFQVCSIH